MSLTPPSDPESARSQPFSWWLFLAACVLVLGTFALIGIGGQVTSLDAGLAVPDGWMTFDVFTPLAPLDDWWHDVGTRWEHSHRLKGYVVGMLTLLVAGGLWFTAGWQGWRRKLACTLVVLVIAQGLMGALRVNLAEVESHGAGVSATGTDNPLSTTFRILHGITGQIFFCLTILAAASVSKLWRATEAAGHQPTALGRRMTRLCFWLWVAFLIQLTLGALVRHTHSALAIPDFPAHYGGLIPPLTQAALDNALVSIGVTGDVAIWQVYLHLAHRLFAWALCATVVYVLIRVIRAMNWPDLITAPAATMVSLLVVQVVLGITVVLSRESAVVATTHQMVGALLIATATWLIIRTGIAARQPDQAQPANPQVLSNTPHDSPATLGGIPA